MTIRASLNITHEMLSNIGTTEPKQCAESYLLIDAQLNNTAITNSVKNMCEKDGANAAVDANCMRGVDGIIEKAVAIPAVDRNAVIRSHLVSWAVMSALF